MTVCKYFGTTKTTYGNQQGHSPNYSGQRLSRCLELRRWLPRGMQSNRSCAQPSVLHCHNTPVAIPTFSAMAKFEEFCALCQMVMDPKEDPGSPCHTSLSH